MSADLEPTLSRLVIFALALAPLFSCGEAPMPAAPAVQESGPAYESIANVKQVMQWVLDPAADFIWDSAGTIITAEGRTELAPTTDEGWAKVRDHAAIVAESGNLLMMPGRAAGSDWIEHARGLQLAAKHAMEAAEAQDADALFDAGGEIYVVCRSCHSQFWVTVEELRPGS